MEKKVVTEVQIKGCIDLSENEVTVDEFTNRFISWLESNEWYFGGGINEYKDKE